MSPSIATTALYRRERPHGPPVSNPETFSNLDDGEYDPSRPDPVEQIAVGIDPNDAEWASYQGLLNLPHTREGAAFIRLAEDVFIIPVSGGQPLHHDRHLSWSVSEGFSEHTWNLVVEPSDGQLLVVETGPEMFSHYKLRENSFIYFNTVNRHMVSRKSSRDTVVLVQVDGYGPDEADAALNRIKQILAARPTPTRL